MFFLKLNRKLKYFKNKLGSILLLGLLSVVMVTVASPQKQPGATVKNNHTITFFAVGDIMFSRGVAARMMQTNNVFYPFTYLSPLLSSSDFNFGNLEGPMTGSPNVNQGHLVFNAPLAAIAGLVKYHFIVNTANNHILDQGPEGLFATLDHLHQNKIPTMGTGENLMAAWQPTFIRVKGEKIAFIGASYTAYNQNPQKQSSLVARVQQLNDLQAAVKFARENADFVIVTMHAGKEYTRNPNAEQIAFAHTAIKAGADIVIGAHPHWIQQIEQYRGKYIFYSLGNFIFDQDWSENTREGLMLKIVLQKTPTPLDPHKVRLALVQLIPVYIDRSIPKLTSRQQGASILAKIGIPPSNQYQF